MKMTSSSQILAWYPCLSDICGGLTLAKGQTPAAHSSPQWDMGIV